MSYQIKEILKQCDKGFINLLKRYLDNFYILYEDLKPKENFEIALWEIDSWEYNRQDKFDITDKRRIRAMLISILRKAKSDGHTVLPLPQENLPSVKIVERENGRRYLAVHTRKRFAIIEYVRNWDGLFRVPNKLEWKLKPEITGVS